MSVFKIVISFSIILLLSQLGFAQGLGTPKVNLEDIKIKGDANTDQANFSNRSRHSLGDRIKLRTNFRKEVNENLPSFYKPAMSLTLPQAPR